MQTLARTLIVLLSESAWTSITNTLPSPNLRNVAEHAGLAHLSSILASQHHCTPQFGYSLFRRIANVKKLFQAAADTVCAVLSAFRAYRASSIPSRSASAHAPEVWASSFLRVAIAVSA
jgi:hypothetical protein